MKLTEKNMSILIGLILGDGYVDDNGRIQVNHGEKQKDYCIYKAKLLHSVCGGKDIKVETHETKYKYTKNNVVIKDTTLIAYRFRKQSKHFKLIREMFYGEDRKKRITNEILKYLTPEAIALWWMDDGCLTKKYTYQNNIKKHCGYILRLFTYLSKEQNELIQKYFIDNYDVHWNVVKADSCKEDNQYMLRCGTIEGRKFLKIIKEYIDKNVPSMSYKVIDI